MLLIPCCMHETEEKLCNTGPLFGFLDKTSTVSKKTMEQYRPPVAG